MTEGRRTGHELDETVRTRLEGVLSRYPISFAMVFGSASRGTSDEQSDVDMAIEFDDLRPDDVDYNDVYLSLVSELAETLSSSVDVVDVHTMSPRFARAVFEDGTVVLGSETRRTALEAEIAAEELSVEDARDRVAASVARLQANET